MGHEFNFLRLESIKKLFLLHQKSKYLKESIQNLIDDLKESVKIDTSALTKLVEFKKTEELTKKKELILPKKNRKNNHKTTYHQSILKNIINKEKAIGILAIILEELDNKESFSSKELIPYLYDHNDLEEITEDRPPRILHLLLSSYHQNNSEFIDITKKLICSTYKDVFKDFSIEFVNVESNNNQLTNIAQNIDLRAKSYSSVAVYNYSLEQTNMLKEQIFGKNISFKIFEKEDTNPLTKPFIKVDNYSFFYILQYNQNLNNFFS